MASVTSVISLFIVLLVTYSYGKPVVRSSPVTTDDEFTTGSTTVEYGYGVNMRLISDDEWSTLPTMHESRQFDFSTPVSTTFETDKKRSKGAEESESEETTQPSNKRSFSDPWTTFESVTMKSRSFVVPLEDSTPVDVPVEKKSVTDSPLLTTFETDKKRSEGAEESESEETTQPSNERSFSDPWTTFESATMKSRSFDFPVEVSTPVDVPVEKKSVTDAPLLTTFETDKKRSEGAEESESEETTQPSNKRSFSDPWTTFESVTMKSRSFDFPVEVSTPVDVPVEKKSVTDAPVSVMTVDPTTEPLKIHQA